MYVPQWFIALPYMYCDVFLSCVGVLFCKIRRPLVFERIEHSLQCEACRVQSVRSWQCAYCRLLCSAVQCTTLEYLAFCS